MGKRNLKIDASLLFFRRWQKGFRKFLPYNSKAKKVFKRYFYETKPIMRNASNEAALASTEPTSGNDFITLCAWLSNYRSEIGQLYEIMCYDLTLSNRKDYILPENMAFFEIAKEYLQYGLREGIFLPYRMSAIQLAITKIDQLINKSVEINAKVEIARATEEQLERMGKTNVSSEELEDLINHFLNEGTVIENN